MVAALFLIGCTSIPKNYPKAPSTAFKGHKSTSIGKMFDKEAAKHPGKSGFDIIRYGRQGFTARIAMTEMAEKSLDLQYYLWEPDATGRLLAYHVLKAADRGVKVRVLLDDIGLESRDTMIASLDAHPNIEIRIFNPFAERSSHGLNFLTDFDRVNHRMHNKTFLMDNSLAIIGGRNIGNHYFGVDDQMNFRDLDIVGAGPIVREVSNVYDYFWNGEWSVPMKALEDKTYTQEDMKNARAILSQKIAKDHYPYPLTDDVKKIRSQMNTIRKNLVWAKGRNYD
jgi:putative cardiolipin synthase